MKNKIYKFILALNTCLLLCSCAATHTAISKRNLDVETKMSETIFLDPVSPQQRTVFVQIRNTSGNNKLNLEPQIAAAVASKGYTIVQDPKQAHYLLQANVLHANKADMSSADDYLSEGFGGGLLGAGVAAVAGGDGRTVLGAGLVGAAVGIVANAMVKDVYYTLVTDLQISERSDDVLVTESLHSHLKQGSSSHKDIKSSEKNHWKRYQTRIVSTANQVNLNFDEALPQLTAGLSNSISGLL